MPCDVVPLMWSAVPELPALVAVVARACGGGRRDGLPR